MTEFELFNYLHSEIKEKKIEIGSRKMVLKPAQNLTEKY